MKQIKYNGKWYKVGDRIIINTEVPFLFFWSRKKDLEYTVNFIGDDCGASCITNNRNVYSKEKVIIGSVKYF